MMKTVLFIISMFLSIVSLAQNRSINLRYHLNSPAENQGYQSPSIISTGFYFVNEGPDTLFATDTFKYSFSHSLMYNQKSTEKRIGIGKLLVPGDSIDAINDTIGLNWPSGQSQEFVLGVLLDFFRPGLGTGNSKIDVQYVSDQDSLRTVKLMHLGNVSVQKHKLVIPILYPNPTNDGVCIVETSTIDSYSRNTLVHVSDNLGRIIPVEVEEISNGKLKLHFDAPPGVYGIKISNASTSHQFKLIHK